MSAGLQGATSQDMIDVSALSGAALCAVHDGVRCRFGDCCRVRETALLLMRNAHGRRECDYACCVAVSQDSACRGRHTELKRPVEETCGLGVLPYVQSPDIDQHRVVCRHLV